VGSCAGRIRAGRSYTDAMPLPVSPPDREPSFDALLAALDLPRERLQAFDPQAPRIDAQRPLLVLPPAFEAARATLIERYPAGHPARVLRAGEPQDAELPTLPANAEAWLLAPLAPEQDHRSIAALRAVIERLYAPGGCPWDREQTHETLRHYLLEETYEVAEAIDASDLGGLREELGDLLVQILMHAAMAQEAGEFTLEEVIAHASEKMVRRHPHVFGEEEAGDSAALLARWDEIKAVERAGRGEGGVRAALDAVPSAAPALLRAAALQGRAERAGHAPPAAAPAERLREALGALDGASPADAEAGIGELLWAAVALAREREIDAESALRASAAAFVERVAADDGEPRARPTS
jgi:tetrapyrrole methylase family protein/MazG family protein